MVLSAIATLPLDEKFEYNIKAQLISLGNDDYVGLFNNHVISGNLAKLVEEFSDECIYQNPREWWERYYEYKFIRRRHIFSASIRNNLCTFYFY